MLCALALALVLAQDGPVPPQRVDPESIPTPVATEPALPRGLEPAQDRASQPAQAPRWQDRRGLPTQHQRSPIRARHEPASIFTDEAYRCSRVRWLLERTLLELE